MVNYFEASKMVIQDPEKETIIDGFDYGDFWLFSVGPFNSKDYHPSGTIFIAVFKNDGKIGLYDITTDPEAFRKAKRMN